MSFFSYLSFNDTTWFRFLSYFRPFSFCIHNYRSFVALDKTIKSNMESYGTYMYIIMEGRGEAVIYVHGPIGRALLGLGI